MKRIVYSLVFTLLTMCSLAQLPNNFTISGTVTNQSGGVSIFGTQVIISEVFNNPPSVTSIDTVYTNSNGQYSYTIVNGSVVGPNRTFQARIVGCNGQVYEQSAQNMQGTVDFAQLDFSICPNPQNTCDASFTITNTNPGIYVLNANSNIDAVHQWQYNGIVQTGNPVTLQFNAPGQYPVCHFMFNNSGCQAAICDTIVVGGGGNGCSANAGFSAVTGNSGNDFTFIPTQNQNTYTHFWSFGDGATSTDSQPYHVYQSLGNYNVCHIAVNQVQGVTCADTVCQTITVTSGDICLVDASFSIVSGNSSSTFSFIPFQQQGQNTVIHSWDFGDGVTSNNIDPVHTYAFAGNYIVCHSVIVSTPNGVTCQADTCMVVSVTNNGNQFTNTISGLVSYSNMNTPATDAFVILYELQDVNNTTVASVVDFANVTSGTYSFTNLPDGQYIVSGQILPTSPNNGAYLPTFSVSEALWTNSPTTFALANQLGANQFYTADINLIVVENPIGGPGEIGGGVDNGDTLRSSGIGATIFLQNMSDQVIAYDIVDLNGQFSLTNLPLGMYKLWATLPGYFPQMQWVNITTENMMVNDIQIDLEPHGFTVSVSELATIQTTLYPNPTNGNTTLNVATTKQGNVEVSILNLLGQVVYSTNAEVTTGNSTINLPTQGLSQGVYTVVINAGGNAAPVVSKLIKQ